MFSLRTKGREKKWQTTISVQFSHCYCGTCFTGGCPSCCNKLYLFLLKIMVNLKKPYPLIHGLGRDRTHLFYSQPVQKYRTRYNTVIKSTSLSYSTTEKLTRNLLRSRFRTCCVVKLLFTRTLVTDPYDGVKTDVCKKGDHFNELSLS